MNARTDQQLLDEYAATRSEPAFAELVRRHVDLVHSAARRMVGDAHLAEDVTQAVFVAVAQQAGQLRTHPVLSGWLHRTTQNLAANAVRSNVRRQAREQEAAAMNELAGAATEAPWKQIAPHLDAVLGELPDPDREAVLLRYFERKSARDMADLLGISDDAAQKRVSRAVERLRDLFAKRGVTVGATALLAAISAHAVQAAPAGLTAAISIAALAGTAATTAVTATKVIAMTTLQKTLITGTVAVLAAAGIYEAREASQLRASVQTLRQQQTSTAEQLAGIQAENEQLSNQLAQARASQTLPRDQMAELMRLRGKSTLDSSEIAALKDLVGDNTRQVPEFVFDSVNKFVAGLTEQQRRAVTNSASMRLQFLSASLGLTAEQQQQVRDILFAGIDTRNQVEIARLCGDSTPDEAQSGRDKLAKEEDQALAAVLTPEQRTRYEQMKADAEKQRMEGFLTRERASMKRDLGLNDTQVEQLTAVLTSLKPGEGGPGLTFYSNAREQLDTRLRLLEPILTPDQLERYRKMKMDDIDQYHEIPRIIKALKRPK